MKLEVKELKKEQSLQKAIKDEYILVDTDNKKCLNFAKYSIDSLIRFDKCWNNHKIYTEFGVFKKVYVPGSFRNYRMVYIESERE